jgi:hypothetical protein
MSRKGTKNVYSFADLLVTNPGTLGASSTWTNPQNAVSTSLFASASGTDSGVLTITQFAFDVANPQTGIQVNFTLQCPTACTATVQLVQDGVPIGTPKTAVAGAVSLGSASDLWGASPSVNNTTFGVQIEVFSEFSLASYLINNVSITVYLAGSSSNFQYVKSFPSSNGTLRTLAMDASGEMWVENVSTNPGVLSPLLSDIPAGSYAKSTTAYDREYIAFSNLATGIDIPRQYTGDWIDRITQVGPGAPPSFTPQVYTGNTYAIATITQPVAQNRTSSYYLQSTGPTTQTAGNVVTIFYSDSTLAGADTDLVNAFNSGFPVYVYVSFTGSGIPTQGPVVAQVTSVGLVSPPGQPRAFYYFTYIVSTSAPVYYRGSTSSSYTAHYQRSLATLTTSVPVPGLIVGNTITVTGASVTNYNNTWTITQDIDSGAFVITQTVVSGGTATYSYALSSGVAPVVGQQVTITGTNNANGALNGANLIITAASGGSTGTFSVSVSVPNTTAAAEEGQGVTAGDVFAFDPGAALVGSSTNPIYGNSTGGSLIFSGTLQYISAGTRQGVVFFGTRNDAETFPSTPVIFTIPSNTSTLVASQIPIGPPDTIYRQVAITEAGQLGVPGGNFYTIDNPVTYTVNGQTYVSNSFRINDNTTTSVSLTFRDSDLLSARPIDVQGGNLFNQIEIGNPAWIVQYAGRMFYGLTQSKIQNFVNLSFDGGYLSGSLLPLGWAIAPSASGNLSLIDSPIFGSSLYTFNTTGSTLAIAGLITQTAYLDYYGVQIIRPNMLYSVRVTARSPSGIQGTTFIDLSTQVSGNDQQYGSFQLPTLATTYATYTGTLLTTDFDAVPAALLLRVYTNNLPAGGDVEIDRIEIFPTRQPVNETQLLVSYEADPEGVDGESGQINTNSENTQPCYGAVVMYDLLYLLKDRSMYYTQDSSGDEPANWGVHEVSNKAGACGVNAYDSGEEWILTANRNGVYLFTGGEPRKISQEIQQVWDALNWSAGQSIWLRNDVQERKFYIGVPLPTPNFWLPDAPVNAAPTFPNVVLMCSYEGQMSGSDITDAAPVFATQFGNLDTADLRRKWSIQQIPSPYADFITQANGSDNPLLFGNGLSNSKIYALTATNDDGAEIPWRYVTYGFGDETDVQKYPALGAGRKRWSYLLATITGVGNAIVSFFSNRIDSTTNYTVPGGVALAADDFDRERPLNIPGNRVYVEYKSGGLDSQMDLSQMTLIGSKDVYNSLTGKE